MYKCNCCGAIHDTPIETNQTWRVLIKNFNNRFGKYYVGFVYNSATGKIRSAFNRQPNYKDAYKDAEKLRISITKHKQ